MVCNEEIAIVRRTEMLCAHFGNPEQRLKFIHVAGTNGKGSVCKYLYESLRCLGYSVGLFTSPHIKDVRERFEIDGALINTECLDSLTLQVSAAAELLFAGGEPPTEFEIFTVVGFLFFAQSAPDFVILETGLGGRGDATNVIEAPLISVITQIALDHIDKLGNTVEQIAWEKAGIIKSGCPVVSGVTGAAATVIKEVSAEKDALLIDASRIKHHLSRCSLSGCVFDADIGEVSYLGVELSMTGEHQVQNALTALCALTHLEAQGHISLDIEPLYLGLKAARNPARLQVLSTEPLIIIDGAHNPDGAHALTQTLERLFPSSRLLFVCSFQKDKAVREILKVLSTTASAFIALGSNTERGLDAAALGALMRSEGLEVLSELSSPKEAYETALRVGAEFDAVIFAGSFYSAGDVLKEAAGKLNEPS